MPQIVKSWDEWSPLKRVIGEFVSKQGLAGK